MKKTIAVLIVVLLGLLAGCKGGSNHSFPNDPNEVRRLVSGDISQISFMLSAEDADAASAFVSDLFILQPGVAQKFGVGPFTGQGRDAFRGFFERVIERFGDLNITISINNIAVDNDIATAHVTVIFHGDVVHASPPQPVNFTEQDVLVFEWNGHAFVLVNWGEDNGNSHNQGGGGGV